FKETPRLVRVESAEEKEERELLEKRDALYIKLIEKLPSVKEALTLLDNLPEGLVYHTKAHTEDVIKETILFALADGVSDGAIEQQVIAAAWHDIGYLERKSNNEPVAVEYFERSVAQTGLKPEVREEIISNITDTAMVFNDGKPHLHMERSALGYMLDADVSNFGREDFFICMEKIAKETGADLENQESRANFYAFVITLLKNHDWHTEGARRLRQKQKDKNLDKLMAEYESLRPRAEEKYRLRRAA
ncbi:MAG: hypothetical protein NUW00_05770, partial [Candidatus Kaiserbacteria bacterium]|nr:hypothetical protein [Candidatus Kaiserbacteria bacterium]